MTRETESQLHTLSEALMKMTRRLRRGIALIAVATLIFVWSLWLLGLAYDANSAHCDTIDLWSLLGTLTSILMIVGSCLFTAGFYLVLVPQNKPMQEDEGEEPGPPSDPSTGSETLLDQSFED